MTLYARILSRYPYTIILVVLLVVAACLVVTFTAGINIDFDNPLEGFEPRGTEIADRLLTFENLLNNVGDQTDLLPHLKKEVEKNASFSPHDKNLVLPSHTSPNHEKRSLQPKMKWTRDVSNDTQGGTNFFCEDPDKKKYSRIIVESSEGRSLFNLEDIQAICQLEAQYFLNYQGYQDGCKRNEADGGCCAAWSIGSYITLFERIVIRKVTIMTLTTRFLECSYVPGHCWRHGAIFYMFYYLSDSDFMHSGDTFVHSAHAGNSESFLKFSALFLPVYSGSDPAVDIFQHLDSKPRDFKSLKIVGADFGVKFKLFEKYLISDSVWLGVACGTILIAMWLYTTSIFITAMALLSLFWAVDIAYVLYTYVFRITFFPYMNLVTLIVMIGIGADDLFIYCKIWQLAKSEKNNGVLEKLVGDTLHHSVFSMLVTSLTTAAAFYANYISDITAIRCFSIFAGTCIVINFILTITWLPASIMLQEKWLRCCVDMSNKKYNILYCLCKPLYQLYYLICDWSRIFFEKILPCLVIKFRFLWLAIFTLLWVGSVVVIFFHPRLKLPTSQNFQVFSSNHLIEHYDLQLSERFPFELKKHDDNRQEFYVTIVWGVLAKDNGDPLDPKNRGSLTFDPDFDLASPNAQKWILQFCSRLRNSDFYLQTSHSSYTDCLPENFQKFMAQNCSNVQKWEVQCCNSTFPLPRSKFMSCLTTYVGHLPNTPYVYYNQWSPGPRFSDGKITAFFVQLRSSFTLTMSYEEVHSFYTKVNQWVLNELLHAPLEMKNGWFVSDLNFYDLQSSLAMGTPLALGLSLSIVAFVSFFTTLNVLVSIYAFLSVAGTICVTLASLVLMDWELNILESVIITIAIGLAIDITLHYGVAYRLAPDIGKEMRVITSLGHMGSPVAMATLTTMLAGALIMPSTVLAYRKFGTFLLLLVSLAWLYATFFFQSLLRIMGPNGGCGQFHWPASDCCAPGSRDHVDKTVYTLSESTLSTSSTSTRETSHGHSCSSHHELEPLTGQDLHSHHLFQQASPSNNNVLEGGHRRQEIHHHSHHHHHPLRRKGDYVSMKSHCTPPPLSTMQPNPDSASASPSDEDKLIAQADLGLLLAS
ncbi:Protein dispatched 1 [Bulinus truncatus]|nr:Protein dispatched 1 [Bulinus truncatus]